MREETIVPPPEDIIRINDRYYVAASSPRVDDRTRVLKHGDTFAVLDRLGDIETLVQGSHGIYHNGTRFCSGLEMRIGGQRPLLLNSTVTEGNHLITVDLSNPELPLIDTTLLPNGALHIFRGKLLWRGVYYEHIRLTNYCSCPAAFPLTLRVAADYADIFEVRGMRRAARGRHLDPTLSTAGIVLAYEGRDKVIRRTHIRAEPPPNAITESELRFDVTMAPKDVADYFVTIACEGPEPAPAVASYYTAFSEARDARSAARSTDCEIHTSNELFNDWLNRSFADLHMLMSDTPHGRYPYAGVPWYSTPFGRDGIITALQCLWVKPGMARGVLSYLAATQATAINADKDAEPGKILHETRQGEMAALGEIPFGQYYGTVDATPLFILLAGAYHERTGDTAFIERLWPNVQLALAWIDTYGDIDGDGFVEYQRRTPRGLVNQGWKDSHDAVFHANGQLAEGPIALCEVQGYVYAAKCYAAVLADALGDPAQATILRAQAQTLKEKFNRAFWREELNTYALALDGLKQPCSVKTSNAGHLLFTGIADASLAYRTAHTMLSDTMFSGWGVRTVATDEVMYNPLSYHNGSVWPHDNSLIACGLARYDLKEQAVAILRGLFDASIFMDLHRLPELFCGLPRREEEGPTLYPVACLPQAWASATPFYLLQACLGLSFGPKQRLCFRYPLLPPFLARIEIRNLRVGDASVDLEIQRYPTDVGVNITRGRGEVELTVIKGLARTT